MRRWYSFPLICLLLATGCRQTDPLYAPVVIGQRTVTVSADDPFIEMEDGTRIPVDGVPVGQSRQFTVTQYRDGNGEVSVEIDAISAVAPQRK